MMIDEPHFGTEPFQCTSCRLWQIPMMQRLHISQFCSWGGGKTFGWWKIPKSRYASKPLDNWISKLSTSNAAIDIGNCQFSRFLRRSHFDANPHIYQLKKSTFIFKFSRRSALLFSKNGHILAKIPVLGKLTHIWGIFYECVLIQQKAGLSIIAQRLDKLGERCKASA